MLTKKRRNLIFLEAFILTTVIYFFAIVINGYLDEQRIDELDYKITQSSLDFESMVIIENFFSQIEKNNCELKKEYIYKNFQDLKKIGTDLSNYGQLFLKENANLSLNKQREYFLEELALYRTVIDYNKICEEDIVPILYFFNSKSVELDKQSLILEQFTLNHKNETVVFSFDINYKDEPLLEMIKKDYNVTYHPFIIINEKTTTNLLSEDGVVSLNTLTIEYKKMRGELNAN